MVKADLLAWDRISTWPCHSVCLRHSHDLSATARQILRYRSEHYISSQSSRIRASANRPDAGLLLRARWIARRGSASARQI